MAKTAASMLAMLAVVGSAMAVPMKSLTYSSLVEVSDGFASYGDLEAALAGVVRDTTGSSVVASIQTTEGGAVRRLQAGTTLTINCE